MTLKEVQTAILAHPDDRDIAFLLAFYHNELVTKNSIDLTTIDDLFEWASAQGVNKIGLYAGIGLLRHFFHMKSMINHWNELRNVVEAWMVETKYQDIDRALCGLREKDSLSQFAH